MRQIQTFNPARLTNAAHGQYVTNLNSILNSILNTSQTENEKFKSDLAALEAAFKVEDEAYLISRKSDHTIALQEADAMQDNGVNGLKALIVAASYDPAKADHARKVDDAIRPYKLDAREQVAQEAYKVLQCATALESSPLKESVTTIGATAFVAQMKQGAEGVNAAILARNDERATLTPAALANARIATDNAIREMLFTADAMLTLFGDDSLPLLANKVNELIAYTQQHMVTAPAIPNAPADPNAQPNNPNPAPTPDAPNADGHTGSGVVTPVKPV